MFKTGLAHKKIFTTLLVPVMYAIFVLDVKLISWDSVESVTPQDTARTDASSADVVPES